MDYNYHTHTHRCHHATGEMEEYIVRAMENGIKYMGFSDHIPYICSDGYEALYRINSLEVREYIAEARHLKEKYKDKIDVKIGFEMEYYPGFFEKMLESAIACGGEYLILGEHFITEEHPDMDERYSGHPSEDTEKFNIYLNNVIEAMKTGVFTYVAHPDLFRFEGSNEAYDSGYRKICRVSRELNLPLEINFLGIRDDRFYPNDKFWKIAGEEKSPVTFGFDAHDVQSAFDGESIAKAKKLVEKYKLNYIGKPEIIDIRKARG